MARVNWTVTAALDLERIRVYIQQFDPAAAARIHKALRNAGNGLADFPRRGRPASRDRRELPSVPPYVIRYRVVDGDVIIESVRHGARRPD